MIFLKTAETLQSGAKALPVEFYTESAILEREFETIFLEQWICAGRSDELSEKCQYKTVNIGTESVIIFRNDEGELNAFFNVCRHRGTRICIESKGKFPKSIQCGYHGWTYDLDGNLSGAPHMDEVNGFKKEDFPLHKAEIFEWEGFIFVNHSDNPEPFEKSFAPVMNRFSLWGISTLVVKEHKTYDVNCNWKLVIQNYNECYHCPTLHPELADIHHYMGGRNDLHEGPCLGGYMDFHENVESITSTRKRCCPPLKGVKDENLKRVYYYSIFPNMLLSLHPEYVMVSTIWPNGVDKTTVRCEWLFTEESANSNQFNTKEAIDFWDITNKQDWAICEKSQLGIQSKKYIPGPYSGQESLLAAFDTYYLTILNKLQ